MTRYELGAVHAWIQREGGYKEAAKKLLCSEEALRLFVKGSYDPALERRIRSMWDEILKAVKPQGEK